MNRFPHSLAALLLLFATMPCPSVPAQEKGGSVTVRSIIPSQTDSRIDTFSGPEYKHWMYYSAAAKHRGELLVVLPGTGGHGGSMHEFDTLAATLGYHVVDLSYPTNISMSTFDNNADPHAFGKARNNILYGSAPFETVHTTEPNSIHNRLHKLVQHLAATYPDEHWGQFLGPKGGLIYGKMALAGLSQGGGHAVFFAVQHKVARVIAFGAPKDFSLHFHQPGKWLSNPCATPLDRIFCFVHDKDEGHGCTYAQQIENYKALGLLPRYSIANVDVSQPPYRHTRLLTSDIPAKSPHACVALNQKSFAAAWKYMLEEPVQ